jgi:hypothetical protein
MTLFSSNDIIIPSGIEKSKSDIKKFDGIEFKSLLGKRYQKLKLLLPKIDKNTSTHYVSMGEWSMHDLVFLMIETAGPLHLDMTTWSIAPEVAMKMNVAKRQGKLLSIRALFDWRVKQYKKEALQIAKQNFDEIKFKDCHSKVALAWNDEYHFTVISSANFTNNPRIEAGVITENKEVFDFHKNWYDLTFAKGNPFEE